MMFVLLLLASQPTTVIPSLSDQELCQSLKRSFSKTVGGKVGPATVLQSGPDCKAKVLKNRLAIDVSGDARERYVSIFMAAAKAGVCDSRTPTVVAFRARHWRWHYEFKFADGSTLARQLDC